MPHTPLPTAFVQPTQMHECSHLLSRGCGYGLRPCLVSPLAPCLLSDACAVVFACNAHAVNVKQT